MTKTATALSFLTLLFAGRVLGQTVVEWFKPAFLPPSKEWDSGLLPYPVLLSCQIVLLAVMATIDWQFVRKQGIVYRQSRTVGTWLLTIGTLYVLTMILRYVWRMTSYPEERWLGGTIPIVFHFILAAYVLVIGGHCHRAQTAAARSQSSSARSAS